MTDIGAIQSTLSPADRSRLAVEHSRDVITTHSLGDWIHTSVNPAIKDVLGYEAAEIIGVPTFDIWHPDDIDKGLLNYDHTGPAVSGKPVRFRARHKKGHYIHMECVRRTLRDKDTNKIVELLCVSRDVTERVKVEQARKRLEQLVESSSDLVLFFSPDITLSYANNSAKEYFSLSDTISSAEKLWDLFPDSCLNALYSAVDSARESGSWRGQIQFSRSDLFGAAVIHEIIYHEHIEANFFSLIARDVSEQLRAENDAAIYRKNLFKVSRLMSASEVSTTMAHELNQPIAAIANFCHGAQARIKKAPEDALENSIEAIAAIKKQAERAGEIIKRLRSCLNKTPYQKSEFDLVACCGSLVVAFKIDLDKRGIMLSRSYPKSLKINGDQVQIEQLIINLLSNAVESLKGSVQENKQISVAIEIQNDKQVLLSVADNCITPITQDLNKPFEAYYSSKDQGLGIGLSMCKSIAESHLGEIWMEPNSGGVGAIVKLLLPVGN